MAPQSFRVGCNVTHFLLYLNSNTFKDGNPELTAQVRHALKAEMDFCLIHETDPARGGVPFYSFFTSTPADIVEAGLYRRFLSTPWHQGTGYKTVSIKLALTALGAKSRRKDMISRHEGRLQHLATTIKQQLATRWHAAPAVQTDVEATGDELLLVRRLSSGRRKGEDADARSDAGLMMTPVGGTARETGSGNSDATPHETPQSRESAAALRELQGGSLRL